MSSADSLDSVTMRGSRPRGGMRTCFLLFSPITPAQFTPFSDSLLLSTRLPTQIRFYSSPLRVSELLNKRRTHPFVPSIGLGNRNRARPGRHGQTPRARHDFSSLERHSQLLHPTLATSTSPFSCRHPRRHAYRSALPLLPLI